MKIFKEFDKNKSGNLNFEEFKNMIKAVFKKYHNK